MIVVLPQNQRSTINYPLSTTFHGQRTLLDLNRQILQHNLFGVDLNAEAIQICQLSLWIKTAARGKQLVERILRHLGAWHDPPAGLSAPRGSGPYTYEPCQDADPMPDYENVLTD